MKKLKLAILLTFASFLMNFVIFAGDSHGFITTDLFPFSSAELELLTPIGGSELITLQGTSSIDRETTPEDPDSDTQDSVPTELVSMALTGPSSLGLLSLALHPTLSSVGEHEELINLTTGVMDIGGGLDSYFDVFFDITVGGLHLYTIHAMRIVEELAGLVPVAGETYETLLTTSLFFADGRPSGYFIGRFSYSPVPPIPEPSTYLLLGSGIIGLAFWRRRRKLKG